MKKYLLLGLLISILTALSLKEPPLRYDAAIWNQYAMTDLRGH